MADIQYLRFKRERKTFFLRCRQDDKIEAMKLKVAEFLGVKEGEELEMRLYVGDRV